MEYFHLYSCCLKALVKLTKVKSPAVQFQIVSMRIILSLECSRFCLRLSAGAAVKCGFGWSCPSAQVGVEMIQFYAVRRPELTCDYKIENLQMHSGKKTVPGQLSKHRGKVT